MTPAQQSELRRANLRLAWGLAGLALAILLAFVVRRWIGG